MKVHNNTGDRIEIGVGETISIDGGVLTKHTGKLMEVSIQEVRDEGRV